MDTLFWDVDTQKDFFEPEGRLPVEGATEIRDNLRRMSEYARESDGRIMGSVDYHHPEDPELSDDPDYEDTFPPHCLIDTEGQKKIPETRPEDPLWIDSEPMDPERLQDEILSHDGEVYFRKQEFDVFSNPNVEPALNVVDPFQIAVYGVTLDVCVHKALQGLLQARYHVSLIEDATRAIEESKRDTLIMDWKNQGVQVISTEDAVSGYIL